MSQTGHSRFPVTDGNIDHIVGILYTQDLVRQALGKRDNPPSIHEVMRAPYFVPESKPLSKLFSDMKQSHHRMAVVVDEYGGTSGLITMMDLLEQIVGDIDPEEDDLVLLDDGSYNTRSSVGAGFKRSARGLRHGRRIDCPYTGPHSRKGRARPHRAQRLSLRCRRGRGQLHQNGAGPPASRKWRPSRRRGGFPFPITQNRMAGPTSAMRFVLSAVIRKTQRLGLLHIAAEFAIVNPGCRRGGRRGQPETPGKQVDIWKKFALVS